MKQKGTSKKRQLKALAGVICFAIPFLSFGQMSVVPGSSAASLAQAIAGSGVTVSNATLNCNANSAGVFTYNGSNLGLNSGIILSTGNASDAANAGSYFCNVNAGHNFSDPDLTSIVPTATLDACVLEFNFVPTCSNLDMTFVFGSEEYPTGVSQPYNDAFAIFLTGPNPAGGTYNAQNIALLPNGTPVSIHQVNAGTNAAYFHNNYSSPNGDVAYNGYTVPVTSVTSIVPCSTYTMKIAIADAGNALYDSGVFISGNGVSCQSPATVTTSATPTSCGNSGTATASVSSYTGTTTYVWHPGGQTTATINNLSAGTYTCVVSLHQTCGVINETVTATVNSVGNNMVLTTAQQSLSCNGASNASATVTPIGGISPYTCTWNTTPPQNGLSASNLAAGTYLALVTDNAGCQSSAQITIAAPPAMQLNISSSPAACTSATGSASVTVGGGGTAPYSYNWSTSPAQSTQAAADLIHGVYSVTVTDAHNCAITETVSVGTQNAAWSASVAATGALCSGGSTGSATTSVNNGSSLTFNYSWSTSPVQNTQAVTGLSAGNYTCIITDNNGCVATETVSVGTQAPSWSASATATGVSCFGGSNGNAAININNAGSLTFNYSWSTSPAQNTQTATGLSAGVYTCIVTDNNGCVKSIASAVSQPNLLSASATTAPTMCTGAVGHVSVTPIGGTAPYNYNWAGMPSQMTNSVQGLPQGQYNVVITDAHNCTTSVMAIVGTTNPTLQITTVVVNSACGGPSGSVNVLSVTPSNPPYSYQWITGQTAQTINGLSPDIYAVTVTDANGCSGQTSSTVNIDPTLPLTVNVAGDRCNQGHGTASVIAVGTPPYQYVWDTPVTQTTQTANDLHAGNYMVVVTDAFNCKDSAVVSIVNQNDAFVSSLTTPVNDLNAGESVNLNVSTNSGWSFTNGSLSDGSAITGTNMDHIFNQVGDYTATYYFTSNNGCKDSVVFELHIKDYMTLYVPNSFSPNDDGTNDIFKAEGAQLRSFEMLIYDNWGNLIATLNDLSEGWDGKVHGQAAPIGTYVYKCRAIDIYGKENEIQGQINLIR